MTAFAVFASGHGSNLERFIEETRAPGETARLALVVSDRPACRAVALARQAGITVFAFDSHFYAEKAAFEREILYELRAHNVEWIVLAGYMRLIGPTLLEPFKTRMLNVHPSVLPDFPGKDAIGQALRAGASVTGVTIHYVDEGMDTGTPIAQARTAITPNDTADTLARRIHEIEHHLYPAVALGLIRSAQEIEAASDELSEQ